MKNIISGKYDIWIILKRLAMYATPVLLLFNLSYIAVSNSQKDALISKYEAQQHESITIVSHVLNTIFIEAYNDLLLVRNSNEFTDYMDEPSETSFYEMQQMLFRIMSSKPNFIQLRYINSEGFEVARVNNYSGVLKIVPIDELQDKSGMYYMESALEVSKDTMYISNFDLNVENNEVKIPYEPVMRFSVPVYQDNILKGIIIINYDGYKILSILNEYTDLNNELIEVGFFDSTNYWEFIKDDINEDNILTISNIDEMIPIYELTGNSSEAYNYYTNGNDYYHLYRINDLKDIEFEFEDDSQNIGIISRFNLDEVLLSSDDLVFKFPSIPYVISFIIITVALIIIILSYQNNIDNLMLSASQYISEYTHDGIVITDKHKRVLYCNNVFEDNFGYRFEEVKGKRIGEFLKGDTKIVLSPDKEDNLWEGNIWDMAKNNMYILKFLKVKLIYDKKNNKEYYIGIYSDPKIDQKVLDKVTWNEFSIGNIENNLLLGLDPIFEKGFEIDKRYIVIVIKISEFINIKYRIREREGNSFVLEIASKLKEIVSDDGIVLAPGSDLFLIRTRYNDDENEVSRIMEVIDGVFTGIRFSDYPSINISYLSGVALSPKHGISGLELLTNAFIALEAIMKLKKTNYLVYNENIYDIVRKDKTVRSELGYAFENNEFSVMYQVQKTTEGETIGVEALVRWKNRRLGNVAPSLFVPIMEESEYISKLGMYVLNRVVNDFRTIKDKIPNNFKVSINLSSNEFMDKKIVSSLVNVISSADLKLENFCFEITETTLVNNLDHTNEVIQYLHERNIEVSIDDFGTGFSSLSYLKTLYADKLKIDRAFIKDYPEKDDGTMIKAIIGMANQLKKDVLVEGVETEEQLNLIRSLRCYEYQGYYGSKPIDFNKFVELFMNKICGNDKL